MNYKSSLNIQKEILQHAFLSLSHPRQWQSTNIIRKRAILLCISFNAILCMIIFSCTVLPSPLMACMALAGLAMLWLVALYPWLTALSVFLCAGLPSLQIPLPGHTIRPVEISQFLCVILIFLIRHHMQLKIPHVLALIFLDVELIS